MDPTGLSKPLTKLIEVCASGIGAVSRPYLIRKTADARSYELKTIAKAIEESHKLIGDVAYTENGVQISSTSEDSAAALSSLEERIESRLSYQQVKRQRNLEAISRVAVEEFQAVEEVSEEPVDDDWISRFFSNAEDVSNETMQRIWGKILAGEVEKPGKFSIRTLEITRNMTQNEAAIFDKIARLAIEAKDQAFVLIPDNHKWLEENYGVAFVDLLLLKELGLLCSPELSYKMEKSEKDEQVMFKFCDHCIIVERSAGTRKQSFPVVVLTGSGKDLMRLVDRQYDLAYAQKFASLLANDSVTIKYLKIEKILPNGRIRYSDLVELPLEKEERPNTQEKRKEE